jgi:hypothetical protein
MPGISQCMVTSFKVELLQAVHNFTTDTFKIALFKGAVSGTYNETTTNYSNMTANSDELVAAGYTAGGLVLTLAAGPLSGGTTAYANFSNAVWGVSLTSSGALIYNSSRANRAVVLLAFGNVITSNTFGVTFPASSATTSIVLIK